MPAILIETGFINNEEDERYINSEEGQNELAESITQAVKRYKNIVENGKNNTGTVVQLGVGNQDPQQINSAVVK